MLRARKSLVMGEIDVPSSVIVSDVGVDKFVLDQSVQVVEAVFGSVTIDIGSKRRASNPSLILGAT